MAEVQLTMKDSYKIPGERIEISTSDAAHGYVFVDITGRPKGKPGGVTETVRVGLHGKRLRRFIHNLLSAESASLR